MFKTSKRILITFSLIAGIFLFAHFVFAANINVGLDIGNKISLAATDPRIVISRIIQIFLGLLGTIAIALIIYAGFLWMTAAGNEDKIDTAKKTLVSAVIGLVIILSAFGIATYVLNQLMQATGVGGGSNLGGGQATGIDGVGVIGACSVESVYPTPNQIEVPRNTAIFITFKEAIDPKTICQTVDAGTGLCAVGSKINITNVELFKTSAPGSPLIDTTIIDEPLHKTFILVPAAFLGSASENTWYTVKFGDNIMKIDGRTRIFADCRTGADGFTWQFEVSNLLDLNPPQVVSSGVFPPPDNSQDLFTNTLPTQAQGSIGVATQPQVFVEATTTVVNGSGPGTPDAVVNINPNAGNSGTISVVVSEVSSGVFKASIGEGSAPAITSATFQGQTVAFSGKYPFSLTASGPISNGNSWTVTITKATAADTLTVGSMVYTFVNKADFPNQIALGGSTAITATNIDNALQKLSEISSSVLGNQVSLRAANAGLAGNNIVLTYDSPSGANHLTIVRMAGGVGGTSTPSPSTSIGNQSDVPMNSVIQINFNDAILPTTVVGTAEERKNVIRVVNAVSTARPAGQNCNINSDCLSYLCTSGRCVGDVLAGKFTIANQYKTVEFTSDIECGVNGCGEKIYCLPANSHLSVSMNAASLQTCANANECISKSPYNKCIHGVCSQDFGGTFALATPSEPLVRFYPQANISGTIDGIVDKAFNSLDGDRNGFADGRTNYYYTTYTKAFPWYNENLPVYSNNEKCQTGFETIIKAVMQARATQKKVLGDITGDFCTSCTCGAMTAAACDAKVALQMKNIGLPQKTIKDGSGNIFLFDENEDEPVYGSCNRDTIATPSCGSVTIPTYFCPNGDNFYWGLYVSDIMIVTPPTITSTNPVRDGSSLSNSDIKINFNRLMMASSLVTGSTNVDNGKKIVSHKNINLWSAADIPVGFWTETQTDMINGIPARTNVLIKHGNFADSSAYRAQAGSGVRDIYQNCYKPSAGPGVCAGVNDMSPSCCNGALTGALNANGNCP